jgi:hypothetical protein
MSLHIGRRDRDRRLEDRWKERQEAREQGDRNRVARGQGAKETGDERTER